MTDVTSKAAIKRYPLKIIASTGVAKTYSPEFQVEIEYAEHWKKVLQRARTDNLEVLCACSGPVEKPLSIHYLSIQDSYHLAKYPDTGHFHATDCLYFAPEGVHEHCVSRTSPGDHAALQGKIGIRLDIGIKRRPASGSSRTGEETWGGNGNVHATESTPHLHLKDLLTTLWTKARLNVWMKNMSGKRHHENVHWYLLQAAEQFRIGHTSLSSFFFASTANPNSTLSTMNSAKLEEVMKHDRRILVAAPLAHYKAGAERLDRLPIYGFRGIPILKMDAMAWDKLQKANAAAFNAWRAGAHVEALIHADVPQHGRAEVLDVALLRVTDNWIPVETALEAKVEAHLVEEGRSFIKPLNAMGESRKLPAFQLSDCSAQHYVPLVVMDRTREPRRVEYYDNKYGVDGWWSWDGVGDMRDIPKASA